jgi:L-fuconolactonase
LIIDAHVHLWRLARGDNVALTPAISAIYLDREPHHLRPLLDDAGVDRVVVVQAAETLAETVFTLGLMRKFPWIAGVVGWIDPSSPSVEEEAAALAATGAIKGVRTVRDDNRSMAWMLDARLNHGWKALEDNDLSLDVLVQNWREIPLVQWLAQDLPKLRIVLNHCGKPDIAGGKFDEWSKFIDELAATPNVVCKLSGLMNCAMPSGNIGEVARYARFALTAFGSKRVMWASDWPPLDLASDYLGWRRFSEEALMSLDSSERDDVWFRTATRIYRLSTEQEGAS